jgi:ribonuclease HI
MLTRMTSTPTIAYTDGACRGNPGPGGWAWAVADGPFASGAEAHTTNQRMEIHAALDAVNSIRGPLLIVSDSRYVVDCFHKHWWTGWLTRGWTNSKKEPVKNRDLWEPLIDAVRSRGEVTFEWVKGHSGDTMNDAVDQLAVDAAANQVGRRGDRWHAGILGADAPSDDVFAIKARMKGGAPAEGEPTATPGTGPKDPRVSGHAVAVGGLRPPELGGYEATEIPNRVRTQLAEILEAKTTMHPDLVVLTGMGLGCEQLAADAAMDVGVPFIAVLPFPDFESAWPATTRRHFQVLVAGAQTVITLSKKTPDAKPAAGRLIAQRDAWIARQAVEAIVVTDGRDRRTEELVRDWERAFDADLWRIQI